MAQCRKGFKKSGKRCLKINSKQARKFTITEIVLISLSLIFGLYYLFFPHESFHVRFSPDWILSRSVEFINSGFPHWVHMTGGVILIILAIFLILRRKVFK